VEEGVKIGREGFNDRSHGSLSTGIECLNIFVGKRGIAVHVRLE